MAKRKRWDKSRPETKALVDEIVHGAFVKEGTMVAFPTNFPGVTIPIPADESHITALDTGQDGIIYGGTSGWKVHLFAGMFHGVTGVVFDMGVVDGASSCEAICCTNTGFVASVNGKGGGGLIKRAYQPLPYDLIQEWGFGRQPFEYLGEVARGERIVDAVIDSSRRVIVGVTGGHLFIANPEDGDVQTLEETEGRRNLVVGSRGGIFGASDETHLWRFDVGHSDLERRWIELPEGTWKGSSPRWAKDPRDGLLYAADLDGRLYPFDEERGFSDLLGRTKLAPVGPMAVTFDGRLFGTCGEGISRIFCYDPKEGSIRDLGVAASVIERRRYGYQFGAAALGRDGEIVFGEDDDGGHLWLYFPRIVAR